MDESVYRAKFHNGAFHDATRNLSDVFRRLQPWKHSAERRYVEHNDKQDCDGADRYGESWCSRAEVRALERSARQALQAIDTVQTDHDTASEGARRSTSRRVN